MMPASSPHNRRSFLGLMALGTAAFTTPGRFADELVKTPAQTEGPFYPEQACRSTPTTTC